MIQHKSKWKTSAAESLLQKNCNRVPTVARYCLDVLTGNIPTGRLVFLAIERFLDDLENGHKRGLKFDQGGAVAIIKFFKDLAFSAKPLVPYEQFIVANLFGWKKADGFRRFDECYIEIGKGNRKTPLAAGIGIYGITADDEASAEVYIVAPTKEQAAICFKDAATIVDREPELRKIVKKFGCTNKYTSGNLSHGSSFMRPIAADRDSLDGPRAHFVIIDEEHEHKDRQVVGKLIAGFKARKQPLCFKITNSGFDRDSICWEDHEFARKVLESISENDAFFAYVCQLDTCAKCRGEGKEQPSCDNCDNWLDEEAWIKTNPALGDILPKTYLHKQVKDALEKPGQRSLVQRLNFCIWTQSEERFISPEAWRECAFEKDAKFAGDPTSWLQDKLNALLGLFCFGGLDLGVVNDFTCLDLYFPRQAKLDIPVLLMWAWAPKNVDHHQVLKERYGYDDWVRNGFLKLTPGNVTDYTTVRQDIIALSHQYRIKKLGYDPAYATEIVQNLSAAGVNMVEHRQGTMSMTYPIKEFHRSIMGREFAHGMNPLLTFMVDNLVVESDGKGNLSCHKPDNPNSARKIDGAVAGIMARGLAATEPQVNYGRSLMTRL
jgi:phage terminase large subunit-like protein